MNISLETLCRWCEDSMNFGLKNGEPRFKITVISKESVPPTNDLKAWEYRVNINGEMIFKDVYISESLIEAKEICENRILSNIFSWGITGALRSIKPITL